MTTRHNVTGSEKFYPKIPGLPPLPAIDWDAIDAEAPALLDTPAGDLPPADAVVITWAESEWAALQHVFVESDKAMPHSVSSKSLVKGWQKYDRGVPAYSGEDWDYWGYFRLVQVQNKRVLLFKSNTHLDWPGERYLSDLIYRLVDYCQPQLLLSIGTAGGTRLKDHIGTVNVVNSGSIYAAGTPQGGWANYYCDYAPDWSVIDQSGFSKLLFPIPSTKANLEELTAEFNTFYGTTYPLSTLNADNLCDPAELPALNNLTCNNTRLLTAATFVVGTTSGEYADFACIEMDDAVIGKACVETGVKFGFIRNISDPAQNAELPAEVQGNWGSAVYETFGFYSSYNGALVAWALLANSS